jgi:DedD protein
VSRLLDSDNDLHDSQSTGDHEISLGIPTILGIFFALALICAIFFGFGYTLGRKSAQTAQTSASPSITIASNPSNTLKPAAGSLATTSHAAKSPAPPPAEPAPTITVPLAQPKSAVAPADTIIAGEKPTTPIQQPAISNQQPATAPTGAFMVQIAAVSSQDIADIELAALKKYGYNVVARHEPQDQLLHIQIGPFATRKDAEAMRANVQAHGFNAIVK